MLPVAIGQRQKAAYRLFDNQKVTAEKILVPHFQRTVERMGEHQRVFAVDIFPK